MNGIYNFEKYRPPYLDTAMLIERKERKKNTMLIILAGIASLLMVVMAMYLGLKLYQGNIILFGIMVAVIAVYVIIGAFAIGRFVRKKGESKWQHQLVL